MLFKVHTSIANMGLRVRSTLGVAGLLLLIALPFAAHLYFFGLVEYRPPESGEVAELIAKGHHARAYQLLGRINADALSPEEAIQHRLQLALCELQIGKPDRAHARLRDLPDQLPVLEEYRRFWMAQALKDMGQVETAISSYQHFLANAENELLLRSARQRLAALYMGTDRHRAAIELYEEQLSVAYLAPQGLFSIARTHLEAGEGEAARQRFVQLMEDYPQTDQALKVAIEIKGPLNARQAFAVASTYHAHKRYADAKRRFQRFIQKHPRDQRVADAHYLLASSQLGVGQYEAAIQTFEKTHEQYGLPSALYRIGGIHVRRNREAKAIAAYELFASRFPQHELADDALWQAAKSAERNNHFAEAERLYRLLVDNHPESSYRDEAGWSIGFTYYCRGEFDSALLVFKRLIDMAQQPHIIDQSLYWAGKVAAELGRSVESQSYYRRAASGFPRSYYSTRAVKLGYSDAGTLTRPAGLMLSALSVEDVEGGDCLRRGDALYSLGLRQEARREIMRAENLNGRDMAKLEFIRDRYEALGFLDRAVRLSMQIFVANGRNDEWDRVYPNYYWEQIVSAAAEANVDPYLVLSVIRQESTFNEGATSRAGALGLMQIMPQTGKTLAHTLGMPRFERSSLYDPDVSIRLGSYFLGDQVRQFAEGPTADMGFELGLAAYNAGPHNARQWLERFPHDDADAFVERIPFKETRLYVKLVLKNYAIYKALSDV